MLWMRDLHFPTPAAAAAASTHHHFCFPRASPPPPPASSLRPSLLSLPPPRHSPLLKAWVGKVNKRLKAGFLRLFTSTQCTRSPHPVGSLSPCTARASLPRARPGWGKADEEHEVVVEEDMAQKVWVIMGVCLLGVGGCKYRSSLSMKSGNAETCKRGTSKKKKSGTEGVSVY